MRITDFEREGTCYDLANQYLKATGRAYIISDALRAMSCNWHFKGRTDNDFQVWCKKSGLVCGGSPFYVGFDSVWYQGVRMPVQQARYMASELKKQEMQYLQNGDSLFVLPSPLPLKKIFVEYLEISRGTAEKLGFRYSDYIGTARFFDYADLFSVTIQAQEIGDTSFVYRNYTTLYDSTLNLFWGGTKDKLNQSNITSSGIVSNNYTQTNFGLTFNVIGTNYSYEHSTDESNVIRGVGKLIFGENKILGSYQSVTSQIYALPFFGKLPWVGILFRHTENTREFRYVFIRVNLSVYLEDL